MNRGGYAQSLAGAATVLSLPLLYLGGTDARPVLTACGLILFTAAMLTTPILRIATNLPVPRRRRAAERDETAHGDTAGSPKG